MEDLYKVVDKGVCRETGHGSDVGLSGDVLAVGIDGMDAEIEPVGNFLAGKPLGDERQNLGLTGRKVITLCGGCLCKGAQGGNYL